MAQGLAPKMTYEQYIEAMRCHKIHTETPTLSQLARKWGLPSSTIIHSVNRGIKRYEQRLKNET